jgi:DinB superfamily
MDASELLQKGNLLVIQVVDGFPEVGWDMPGACGDWSVKDIIAHLSSHEHVTMEVLKTFQGNEPTPLILKFLHYRDEFNSAEVEARKYLTAQQVIDEYQDTQVQTTSLLMQIPDDKVRQAGTMPWYSQDYSLADFIYRHYEHICEHCKQVALFRQSITPEIGDDATAS